MSARGFGSKPPLVSCIMPTADRRPFVQQAIAAFSSQDYAARELVIIDDGDDEIEDLLPEDDRIRYVRTTRRQSLGKKRNEACRLARGELIVHWDDDDWHANWRLSYQVGELLAHEADICGLQRVWFYDPNDDRGWQYLYSGSARWLAGGTLCYRKSLWKRRPFRDVSAGEDTRFVREAGSANLLALERADFYVARIHERNTCRKQTSGASWQRADGALVRELVEAVVAGSSAPVTAGERLRLSAGDEPERRALPPSAPLAASVLPRVSCIMPTADRRDFVRIALDLFAEQTYPNRELVVVDDGQDPIEDLCAGVQDVFYLRVPKQSIGARRNLACERATGEIVVHWDDDDWYAPDRLRLQVEPIIAGTADVTGLQNTSTFVVHERSFWSSSEALHARMFVGNVHGGTLAFARRYFLAGARYPDANLAEDAALLRQLLSRGARLERLRNEGSFVYVRHGRNAWSFDTGTFLDPKGWKRSARPSQMPELMVERYGAALARHAARPTPRTGDAMTDCLGSTRVTGRAPVIQARRCIAFVASAASTRLLDAALGSLLENGGVADAARVVFVVGRAPACERVARRHGAVVIRVEPLQASGPASKAALYSMAHNVQAEQYLCLDVDVLVLGDISGLFARHAALGPGRVLIASELSRARVACLRDALQSIYHLSAEESVPLPAGDDELGAYPHVINDGVFVADRAALLAIDALLRGSPGIAAWVHARRDVRWRQKAALNIALARLDAAVLMDQAYNVQLHSADLEPGSRAPGAVALWHGQPAKILHFNGSSRPKHTEWQRHVLPRG